jgi:hypothetical protein
MFTHDDKLFQRDNAELVSKIQRRRQQKRSGGSNVDETEDFISQQSVTKKIKSEEVFVTPSSSTSAMHHMSTSLVSSTSAFASSVSTPMTPMTPASFMQSPMSVMSTPSGHSNSSTSVGSSSIEEDVAYLKNMNSVLLTELTQMKRKTQTQEDTISWLIQELARTQRHVELMSQQQLSVSSESVQVSTIVSKQEKFEFGDSSSNQMNTNGTSHSYMSPANGPVYTPVSATSTSTYSYEPNTLSSSSQLPVDFTDYTGQTEDFGLYNEEPVLHM